MGKIEDDFYEKKPSSKIGEAIIGLAVVGAVVRIVDPQLFDGVVQSAGHAATAVKDTAQSLAQDHGLSGGPTCAQLDKEYPFVSIQQAGGYKFSGPQTASCAEIQRALEAHHSPIAPLEPQIYQAYAKEGINNGAAMGIAYKEGHYGTVSGVQQTDENIGAIRYASDHTAFPNPNYTNDNGWMDFHAADTLGQPTGWVAGAENHAALIRHWIDYNGMWNGTYKHGGDSSVESIISILSPKSENNTPQYIREVTSSMDTFYKESVDYHATHPDALQSATEAVAMVPIMVQNHS